MGSDLASVECGRLKISRRVINLDGCSVEKIDSTETHLQKLIQRRSI